MRIDWIAWATAIGMVAVMAGAFWLVEVLAPTPQ